MALNLYSHPARQPYATLESCEFAASATSAWNIAWHPYVSVSDHFQIAPQDRDVPAVIRVTSTVSVAAVNCTVTLKYILCTYVTLMNIRSTTTYATTTNQILLIITYLLYINIT